MSWQPRTYGVYYYRSVRVGGRVRTLYFGGGAAGEFAAAVDQLAKLERLEERERLRAYLGRERRAEEALDRLGEAARLLAHAALLAAGYHQHSRGEWRKRRVRKT